MSDTQYKISKKISNFSIILNKVSQNLNYNLQALGLYIYIFSLPDDWLFHKSHLRKVCNIGTHKLNSLLKVLKNHNLINIHQIRDEQGKFSYFSMQVNDSDSYKELDKDLDKELDLDNKIEKNPPFYKNRNTVSVRTVFDAYKEQINKEQINKDKSFCASESDAQKNQVDSSTLIKLDESFDVFWKAYPVKKSKIKAKKIWCKLKSHLNTDLILNDIKKRVEFDHQWKNKQFIPHPTTYLNGKLWTDEIIVESRIVKKPLINKEIIINQPKNPIKFWEPGNPDYDRVHGRTHG